MTALRFFRAERTASLLDFLAWAERQPPEAERDDLIAKVRAEIALREAEAAAMAAL